jgi:replicative DNA helicase
MTTTNETMNDVLASVIERRDAERDQEEALCAAVLRRGEVFAQASEVVTVDSFRIEPLRWLWHAFENLHNAGLKIDQVTAGDELARLGRLDDFSDGPWNGRVYLSRLRDAGDPRSVMSYAENVADYANKRRLLEIMNKGAMWAQNGRRSKDIVTDLMTDLSNVTVYGGEDEYTSPISTILGDVYDWTSRAAAGEIPGVPTGFIDLDRLFGSLIGGNVYVIAGRPGQGKTALLLSIARNNGKTNKRVAIFSLEMSKLQVGQRLLAQEVEVDLAKIVTGKQLDDGDWPKITHGMEVVERWPVIVNDLSSINISQIRQTARRIKSKGGLDLLIVDYIQLASADVKKNATREQEVSAISRGLKYLARELDVPILAAAQLSRAVEQRANKRPVLSDLRESGSLEQDAYSVMFIHRPDLNDEPGAQQNVAQVIVEKHRNGPTGMAELVFRPSFARFDNAAATFFRPNAAL